MLPADELEILVNSGGVPPERIVAPARVEVFDPYGELVGRFP